MFLEYNCTYINSVDLEEGTSTSSEPLVWELFQHLLVCVSSQTFLWSLLPRGHWNAFWFGISDEHTEDTWKWVDGTPLVGG